MFYIYVIQSQTHNNRYIGSTDNVSKRVSEYNKGKNRYTKGRKPWRLVYKEKFFSRAEAMKREKFLKSGQGRKFLNENIS